MIKNPEDVEDSDLEAMSETGASRVSGKVRLRN